MTEPLPVYAGEMGVGWDAGAALAGYEDRQQAAAERVLSSAKQAADALGVPAEILHVPQAQPAEAIVGTAKSRDCGLIVMASHGRRGVRRLLLGSQTAEVLAHSAVPVLVTP